MPTKQFIFYAPDSKGGCSQPKFIFNNANYKKVLKYLEENIGEYFEGSPQRQIDQFNILYDMVKIQGIDISQAINTYPNVLAHCEEIDYIQNIQF